MSEDKESKKTQVSKDFVSDFCHSSSVISITRGSGNEVAITFEKEAVMPSENGEYEINKVAIAVISMRTAQAEALCAALSETLFGKAAPQGE